MHSMSTNYVQAMMLLSRIMCNLCLQALVTQDRELYWQDRQKQWQVDNHKKDFTNSCEAVGSLRFQNTEFWNIVDVFTSSKSYFIQDIGNKVTMGLLILLLLLGMFNTASRIKDVFTHRHTDEQWLTLCTLDTLIF